MHSNQLSHKNIKNTLSFLDSLREEILSMLESNLKNQYYEELTKYKKQKPISKKTMETGLKLTSFFPDWVSDQLIIFYLNKLRKTRS